jgi:hypothetical protein
MGKQVPHGSRMGRLSVTVILLASQSTFASSEDLLEREVGVWRMNSEKSQWAGGVKPTSRQMSVEKRGSNTVRIAFDIVAQDGHKQHVEFPRTYDGKERSVPGQAGITQACDVLDASTSHCTEKRNGKVVQDLLMRLSEDGKTRYVQQTRFDQDGKPFRNLLVYDKE